MGTYDATVGTLLVGIFFNTYLYGLVTYQFAAYNQIKFNDPPLIRYMVLFLFLLDTFHSASVIYMAWYYVVENYNNPAIFETAVWPYQFTPLGTALAALVTQVYLGFRIWRLTSSKILYGAVIILAIPSFILGLCCSIEAWVIKVISKLPSITPLVIAWLTMQVITDAFITITMTIVFSRSRTGFRRMDTVLNRLIRGTIQTGLFAGIFSLGDLISFVMVPNTNLYGMFAIPIGRIYTNTLLDTLLTRESLRAGMTNSFDVKMSNQRSMAPSNPLQARSKASSSYQLEVRPSDYEMYDHSSSEDVRKGIPLTA